MDSENIKTEVADKIVKKMFESSCNFWYLKGQIDERTSNNKKINKSYNKGFRIGMSLGISGTLFIVILVSDAIKKKKEKENSKNEKSFWDEPNG